MPVGVPQGSLLGPLLFLIYENDLPDCHLASDIILYTDDTVISYSSKSVSDVEHHINADLWTVSEWFSRNLLTLNISKCNFLVFGSPQKLNCIQDILVKVEDTLENLLRWSLFTSYTTAVQIWIISYRLHITSLHGENMNSINWPRSQRVAS